MAYGVYHAQTEHAVFGIG